MEICPGVHQVPGLRWSNAYLLVEPARLTLIDSGLPGEGKKVLPIFNSLAEARRSWRG